MPKSAKTTAEVEVTDADLLLRLTGPGGKHLEELGAECAAQLAEADELLELQREEVQLLREESQLRTTQRDEAQRRLAAVEASQRKLLVRARAARAF